MKTCKECKKEIDETQFCPHCGAIQYERLRSMSEVKSMEDELKRFKDYIIKDTTRRLSIAGSTLDMEKVQITSALTCVSISLVDDTISWMLGQHGKNLTNELKKHYDELVDKAEI